MKNFIVTVQIDLGDTDPEHARGRVMHIPFGDHDCGFRIVSVEEGAIPEDQDETLLPEYRKIHRCGSPPTFHLERVTDVPGE